MIEKNEGGPHCDHCSRKNCIAGSSAAAGYRPFLRKGLCGSAASPALCRSVPDGHSAAGVRQCSPGEGPSVNDEFESFFSELSACMERKKRCRRSRPPLMPPRKDWPSGAASPPTDLRSLKDAGWDIHIYRTDKKDHGRSAECSGCADHPPVSCGQDADLCHPFPSTRRVFCHRVSHTR